MNNDKKPACPLIGADSNIFVLSGLASRTLKEHGFYEEAKEMNNRIHTEAQDYDYALRIIMEYVEPVSIDEEIEDLEI